MTCSISGGVVQRCTPWRFFAVITTLRVQLELEAPVRCAYDDLFEHRAQDALSGFGTSPVCSEARSRSAPKREQLLALHGGSVSLLIRAQLLFDAHLIYIETIVLGGRNWLDKAVDRRTSGGRHHINIFAFLDCERWIC